MGKKMKLLQWPSCNHPKTLSYRFNSDDVIKTVNSVFFDQNDAVNSAPADTPESWFTNSSESASFSTESDDFADGESLETVVAGARSERRLFFEPGGPTSSLVAAEKPSISGESSSSSAGGGGGRRGLGESVALAMESGDPYGDFRRSMAEMVEINGVREWEGLEELLGWYLRMNGRDNHAFIVGAFVDLLVELANSSGGCGGDDSTPVTSAATTAEAAKAESFSSAVSRFSSPNCERGRSDEIIIIDEEERNLTVR